MENQAVLTKNIVVINDEKTSSRIYNKGSFGTPVKTKLELSLVEAMYLSDNGRITITDSKNNIINREEFVRKALKEDKRFLVRYAVYNNLRKNSYLPKTALKYGLDFRLYEKGKKPGKEHSDWLVHCVHENNAFTWKGFAGIMRVVNSVRKKLMIAIVDDEGDVTYYEVAWKKS